MSYESLSHSKWDCKYHVVFVPKYRKKVLYGKIRKFLGAVSTVGFEEAQIRKYIRNQEQLEGNGSDDNGEF